MAEGVEKRGCEEEDGEEEGGVVKESEDEDKGASIKASHVFASASSNFVRSFSERADSSADSGSLKSIAEAARSCWFSNVSDSS
jgi:hypothetical protein